MSQPSAKKRLLLVDDHSVVRDGISLWVSQTPDLEVCGTAEQTAAALDEIERLSPDLVITDIGMPGRDGLELTKDIRARWPSLPILIFSVHDEALYAGRALRAGARGFCSKNAGAPALLDSIRLILQGRMAFSPQTTTRLLEETGGHSTGSGPLGRLSDREFEVLRLFGAGLTNQQAAISLGVSHKTVESHSLSIRRKLNLRSPAELIRAAVHLCSHEKAPTTAVPPEPPRP